MRHIFARTMWLSLASLLVPLLSCADELANPPTPLRAVRQRTESDLLRLRSETLVMQARILERRQQYPQALRKYQRAWRYNRENARVVLKQIVPLALKLGRVAEATRYALLLTNSDLDDPFLAERLAMLMADQLQYDRSLQLYRRVLQLRSADPESRDPIAMHFEMGRLYFLTKEYEQAAQSFRVVLRAIDEPVKHQLDPGVRDAILSQPELTYNLIAESFLESGQFEDAQEMFERAAKTEKAPYWLDFQLARVDYRAGRFADAQEKLEKYVRQKLRIGGWTPYQLLESLLEKTAEADPSSDQPGLLVRFRDWLVEDPENFPLLSFVAELTRRRGVLKDAAVLYEKSIESQPTIEAYQGLISTYRQLGDAGRLVDVLGKAMVSLKGLDPFAEEVQQIIVDQEFLASVLEVGRRRHASGSEVGVAAACGWMAIQAKQFNAAEEFISHVCNDDRQHELCVMLALELLRADEAGRAANVFRVALRSPKASQDEAAIRYYLSGALQLEGETEEALRMAHRAAELADDNPDITVRPPWILYHADRVEEAYQAYTKWLDRYAEDYSRAGIRTSVSEARFIMSNICVSLNRLAEAEENLEKVLDEFPEDVAAANDLGFILVDQDKSLERATEMIRFAVAAEPNNAAYRDSLGWALYRAGKFEEAVVELRKAASEETPDPIILDHLGDALRAIGDEELARQTWRKALSLLQGAAAMSELEKKIKQKLEARSTESR